MLPLRTVGNFRSRRERRCKNEESGVVAERRSLGQPRMANAPK
jgi:hypothetical protein